MAAEQTPQGAARALRWAPAPALERLSTRLQGAWNSWAAQWGLAAGTVQAFNAWESPAAAAAPAWQALGAARIGSAGTAPAQGLQHRLFGPAPLPSRHDEAPAPAGVAREVAIRAWSALVAGLGTELGTGTTVHDGPAAPVGPSDLKPWSGAVQIRLPLDDADAASALWLHLPPALALQQAELSPPAAAARRTRPRVVPMAQAIGARRLRLTVELAPVELLLGELQTLRIGDVLTLPHRLDTPLAVRQQSTGGDAAVPGPACHGYLGARDGVRAVELLRTDNELA